MATNTTATSQTHNGNGSTATFAISFSFLENTEVDVTVGGVLKTLGTHYNISGSSVTFTSGNIPPSGTANIKFQRDTNISTKKVDFADGSVLTETDLDNNSDQILFAQQEITDKLGGIEEGATADQTDAEIKTAYENNSDTNAFTDALLSKLNGIESGATADQTNAEIRAAVEAASDSNVFTDNDHTKLNNIEDNATADQTITEIKSLIAGSPLDASHLAADSVGSSELAANSVTTSEIADAELKTLAGMQSGTASKLADSTTLTSDIADLNQIDGLQKATTITDDDTKFPTSGAIVDYVAAQLAPIGGFEAVANENSFPNTQPASGVVISIADAGGLSVASDGTASGQTVGGTTVNISGIATNFRGSSVAAGVRFLVSSTGSGQNYTYHKATLKEDDLVSLSGDINDFANRYRVGSSNPTTSLDNGDLFFNTSTGKMLVYNGTNTAWEEVQSIGNFFISTLSPAFDGSTQNFTLSDAPTNAQQVLLIIEGVVQKPNAGTSTPTEGFALDGSTVKLAAAPATGASYHAVVMGSTVNIGTPSNNTVTTAILQNNSVSTQKIQDESITLAKLEHGTSSNNGKFLRANNGADPSFEAIDLSSKLSLTGGSMTGLLGAFGGIELGSNDTIKFDSDDQDTNHISFKGPTSLSSTVTYTLPEDGSNGQFLKTNGSGVLSFGTVNTDLVGDTSPQLGGDLDTNSNNIAVTGGNNITIGDNGRLRLGASNDLDIYQSGTNGFITNSSGSLNISTVSGAVDINKSSAEYMGRFLVDGAVELYHNNSKKLETTSGGATVTGTCTATAFAGDGSALTGITSFVSGMIILWSGAENAIPSGWVLCNGSNSTPDLRNRFVVGAGNSYSVGDNGGSVTATDTVSVSVSGSGTTGNQNWGSGSGQYQPTNGWQQSGHNHSFSFSGSGSDTVSIDTRSPYYALCYIMKT